MPDKPRAELSIDEALVRELLAEQAGGLDAAALSIAHAADGWDCSVWRVGHEWAARLPRREMAAPLVRNEQLVLPGIAARLAASGIRVPAPVLNGVPGAGYPWAWSLVPWLDGTRGIDVPHAERHGWAAPLAAALRALHAPAAPGYPRNPFRGVPLAGRADAVATRLGQLRAERVLTDHEADAAASVWASGLAVSPWTGPPVWIHGDLHPANLVAQGPRLIGIIDFGDVTAGDPAYDLAVAWMAFDSPARAAFIAALGDSVDDATWVRARAWALSVALMLLAHSDDEPAFAALGREALDEAIAEPGDR